LKLGIITTYDDWKKVDSEEIRRGGELFGGKERERMDWDEAKRFLERVQQ
jgi:adrenodoxin-NADP+ reductase